MIKLLDEVDMFYDQCIFYLEKLFPFENNKFSCLTLRTKKIMKT